MATALCSALAAQQSADPDYDPVVTNPVYASGQGPRVAFDEGHGNFHKLTTSYLAFGQVLTRDGYAPESVTQPFSRSWLDGFDVLVIQNPGSADDSSAFSDQEIAEVVAWVEDGGALFLIVDSMPWPAAADRLASSFGIHYSNGFAARFDRMDFGFSRAGFRGSENFLLADHPISNGRPTDSPLQRVNTFIGAAFQIDGEHEPLLVFTGDDIVSLLPAIPWEFDPPPPSISIQGWLQGGVLRRGAGRVAAFGEAAMFSAQVERLDLGARGGGDPGRFGMNVAPQNLTFLRNVMLWLAGGLPVETGPTPVLTSQGVVNAASFASAGVVAPGAFVSLFGSELAAELTVAEELPLPMELGGTSATISGLPVALLVVSSGQINGVVPYGVNPGSTVPLIVSRNGVPSVAAQVTVAGAAPGVFTTSQTGQGQGVIVRVDPATAEQAVADESNPAAAGEALVIYCSGLGPVSPAVATGAAAPSVEPLSRVSLPVEVTVGGVPAQLLFAGLTPGFAGLYQLNVILPPGVEPGPAVEVVVAVDGVASAPVTIAVR